jgi:RimJ/RimL family protein N-acetyltransferase
MTIPTIHTQRLTLRPLQTTDAATLQRIYQVDGVLRYFPNHQPPPLDRIERNLLFQQAHWEQHGCGNWGVLEPGQPEIVGWAGLQFLPETGETEVGFLLDRPFWGRGFATEAALASLKFGFEKFQFPEIIALVHPENLASQRVIAKCKMPYVDHKVYFGIELLRYRLTLEAYMEKA